MNLSLLQSWYFAFQWSIKSRNLNLLRRTLKISIPKLILKIHFCDELMLKLKQFTCNMHTWWLLPAVRFPVWAKLPNPPITPPVLKAAASITIDTQQDGDFNQFLLQSKHSSHRLSLGDPPPGKVYLNSFTYFKSRSQSLQIACIIIMHCILLRALFQNYTNQEFAHWPLVENISFTNIVACVGCLYSNLASYKHV